MLHAATSVYYILCRSNMFLYHQRDVKTKTAIKGQQQEGVPFASGSFHPVLKSLNMLPRNGQFGIEKLWYLSGGPAEPKPRLVSLVSLRKTVEKHRKAIKTKNDLFFSLKQIEMNFGHGHFTSSFRFGRSSSVTCCLQHRSPNDPTPSAEAWDVAAAALWTAGNQHEPGKSFGQI